MRGLNALLRGVWNRDPLRIAFCTTVSLGPPLLFIYTSLYTEVHTHSIQQYLLDHQCSLYSPLSTYNRLSIQHYLSDSHHFSLTLFKPTNKPPPKGNKYAIQCVHCHDIQGTGASSPTSSFSKNKLLPLTAMDVNVMAALSVGDLNDSSLKHPFWGNLLTCFRVLEGRVTLCPCMTPLLKGHRPVTHSLT